MENRSKLEQLLLLKGEYKVRMTQGDKKDAKRCLDEIARIYNEITGKDFWDHFSNIEIDLLKNSLDYNIEKFDVKVTNKDDVIR